MSEINLHFRTIRSYMRRGGRASPTQRQALTTLSACYMLTLEAGQLDLDSVFGRQAPRILEIGFGMGQSLLTQAQQNPDKDYIGIDVHKPGVGAVLAAIAAHNLANIRLFCADAVEVLARGIPDHSLDSVQIFFPDPWPKRRHHKRRLIQWSFVELLRSKLKSAGKLYLATDWQDYADHMLKVLTAAPGWKNVAGENQFAPRAIERPLTKFELRGQRLGHQVWDLLFVHEINIATKSL